jgi:hypothetical protein
VRRRRKTHTLCGVSAQATPPAALTPGASSAGNATVGAPPDGNDPEAAIPPRRGAASSTVVRMGMPPPNTRRAGATGAAAQRSPHGFAQGRTVYAYAPPQESPADDSNAPAHGGALRSNHPQITVVESARSGCRVPALIRACGRHRRAGAEECGAIDGDGGSGRGSFV